MKSVTILRIVITFVLGASLAIMFAVDAGEKTESQSFAYLPIRK